MAAWGFRDDDFEMEEEDNDSIRPLRSGRIYVVDNDTQDIVSRHGAPPSLQRCENGRAGVETDASTKR